MKGWEAGTQIHSTSSSGLSAVVAHHLLVVQVGLGKGGWGSGGWGRRGVSCTT